MQKRNYILLPLLVLLLSACQKKNEFDASGTFEATETIVSSETSGEIKELHIQEGQHLDSGQMVGYIDTTELYLHKEQLLANQKAILATKPDLAKQIEAIQQQIANAETEKHRTENLVNANAVPRKELDDINEQIKVLRKQLDAQRSSVNINTNGIVEQSKPVYYEAEQIEEQLQESKIINPVSGTVLAKYAEQGEITAPGKPFYRIANLSVLTLRAYISNSQLSQVKIGQRVNVFVDNGDKTYKQMTGKITWISDKAEFTPKTIQTKEERANLVYAMKIDVKNDGYLKIGMYGEVKFK